MRQFHILLLKAFHHLSNHFVKQAFLFSIKIKQRIETLELKGYVDKNLHLILTEATKNQ